MNAEFDREKLKDAVHYIAARAGARPGFGAIKLYKVLWFSDARQFVLTGEPITGEEYIRRQYGPVPKHSLEIRDELQNEGRVRVWRDQWRNKPLWRYQALQPADVTRFKSDELQVLDFWIKHIDENHTAGSISDESHDYGWEIAHMGETLPLHAFLAERLRDPTEQELTAARRRMGFLGI